MLKERNWTLNDLKELHLENNETINMENLSTIIANENFVRGIHKVVKYQAENSSAPTYLYKFTYKKENSILETLINKTYKGNIYFHKKIH